MKWMCNLYSFLLFSTLYYYQVETYKLPSRQKGIVTTQNKYPLSKKYYSEYLERMNQHNKTTKWMKTPSFSKRAVTTNYGRKYDNDDEEEYEEEEYDDIEVVDENGNKLEPTTHEKQILNLLNSFGGWIQIPPIEIQPVTEPSSEDENKTPSLSNQFMKDVSKRKQRMQNNKKIKESFIRSQSQGQGGYKNLHNSKPVLSSENFYLSINGRIIRIISFKQS